MIFNPAFVLLFGALFVPLFKDRAKSVYVIFLPLLALAVVAALPMGMFWQGSWLAGFGDITLLRVDKLSKAFGYIFTINAAVAFIYAFYVKDNTQHVSALLYIGSALGAVFAGDLISLYIFWEIMAITSTMLILARRSKRSSGAAFRYLMIHIVGGLFFLAGIVLTFNYSGSIAFEAFDPVAGKHAGSWLILIGFLVNAAAPPFSAWLSDAYPEATITGAVILSAYTTKTAVYALIRGFPGWDILVVIGCLMTVYGIVYALLENDIRRILAYAIISQVGFMVCAVGVGTAMCLDGAVAHAFCHIIYKSLLWMTAGAVIYRVGTSKCTELGGLFRSMPWTLGLGVVGALAMAMPLTSGFTSKTMILAGTAYEHLLWPWLILELASAGVFLSAGIKFHYFVFFAKDRGHQVEEAPRSMLFAMGILAFLCVFLGLFPQPLYAILPHAGEYHFNAWTLAKVVAQMQLLLFSVLTFFVWLRFLQRGDTIVLDTDWFYRRGGPAFYGIMDRRLNSINSAVHRLVIGRLLGWVAQLVKSLPARLAVQFLTPFWKAKGLDSEALDARSRRFHVDARLGAFPIGITVVFAVVLLGLLFVF